MDNSDKIGIVLPFYNELKGSHKRLIERLKKIYSKTFKFKNIIFYWHNHNCNICELVDISVKILEDRPSKIIIHDISKHPYNLMKMILSQSDYSPEFYIQLWNNMVKKAAKWNLLGELLRIKGIKTQLIATTKTQEKFINQFFNKPNSVKTCTMPIVDESLFFDKKKRDQWREENNVREDDFVIMVYNDLTIESNFPILLKEIYNTFSETQKSIKILIVGNYKDSKIIFWNIHPPKGNSFHQLSNIFKEMSISFTKNIRFVSQIEDDISPYIFNGIDCCINLSLNQSNPLHQKSTALASACGVICITSNWGNLCSLDSIQKINISITNRGLVIDRPQISSQLIKSYALTKKNTANNTDEYKKEISKNCLEHFSKNSTARSLKKILSTPSEKFPGFNWKLGKTDNINLTSSEYKIEGSLYKELFDNYK